METIDSSKFIGRQVTVFMDRPMGSSHPHYGFEYPVNYGYVLGTLAHDGEALDVYVLNVEKAVQSFHGLCVAVIERVDDADDKLVVVPIGSEIDDGTIRKLTHFQEQFFTSRIIRKL